MSDNGHCRFNCRTGRMWYFAGYRKMAGYKVPKEILEEYYQDEKRKINDRQTIIRGLRVSSDK